MKLPRQSKCVMKHLITVVKIKFMKPRVLSQFGLLFTYLRKMPFSSVGILGWDIVFYVLSYTDLPITTII
jgi:hypothetical protein